MEYISSLFGSATDVVIQKAVESIKKLEPEAEAEIEDLGRMLDRLKDIHVKHDMNEMATKVLRGTSKIMAFVKNVAKVHPAAQAVVTVISGAVDLEVQHRENSAQIAVVHAAMAKTVLHMSLFLTRIPSQDETRLNKAIGTLFSSIADTIYKFTHFVDTYHTHHFQRTVKVLFAHLHKTKIKEFEEQFQAHRNDMDDIYKSVTQVQLTTVVLNTKTILAKLNEKRDPRTQEAEDYIAENGGADVVMKDPKHVDEVAKRLSEKATHGMKNILQAGFDELLWRHLPVFDMRYKTRQTFHAISERLALMHLKSDSHHADLIKDAEFRKLWQDNQWRFTVKCRVFVEGIHEHYYRRLRDEAVANDDDWTLEFFSRSMYHSAIGDVIDEDGSGHLTTLELDTFLTAENRRRPDWTNPQWFAFWACGWYNNNAWYYGEIDTKMKELESSIQGADMQPSEAWDLLTGILRHLKPLILVADVEDFSGVIAVPNQLRRLQEEFRQFEESAINGQLQKFGVRLVDKTSLMAVVQDSRIELHMMPLLYILTKRLHELVTKIMGQNCQHVHRDDLALIEELATSFISIFVAFDGRLRDLERGWRFEAKNTGLQVSRYADGLFKKYYETPWNYRGAYEGLCESLFGTHSTLPNHLRPAFRPLAAAPVDQMTAINLTLQALDRRLSMLDQKMDGLKLQVDKLQADNAQADRFFVVMLRRLRVLLARKDRSKDQAKDQVEDQSKDQSKDQPKDERKDQSKKQSQKGQPKAVQSKDQPKDQPKDLPKDPSKEKGAKAASVTTSTTLVS